MKLLLICLLILFWATVLPGSGAISAPVPPIHIEPRVLPQEERR